MHGTEDKVRYRVFAHTADLGVEIFGDTPEAMFENAAFALFDIITDIQSIKATDEKIVSVEGLDREDLLVNYLREVLYLWNGEGFIVKECFIQNLSGNLLKGIVKGESFDPSRHRIKTEIKAITYHQVSVAHTSRGWTGRFIVDV